MRTDVTATEDLVGVFHENLARRLVSDVAAHAENAPWSFPCGREAGVSIEDGDTFPEGEK